VDSEAAFDTFGVSSCKGECCRFVRENVMGLSIPLDYRGDLFFWPESSEKAFPIYLKTGIAGVLAMCIVSVQSIILLCEFYPSAVKFRRPAQEAYPVYLSKLLQNIDRIVNREARGSGNLPSQASPLRKLGEGLQHTVYQVFQELNPYLEAKDDTKSSKIEVVRSRMTEHRSYWAERPNIRSQ